MFWQMQEGRSFMLGSKKLLQFALVALACAAIFAAGSFIANHLYPHAAASAIDELAPRQLLDQLAFSKRAALLVDGRRRDIWTSARTVEEAIHQAGVELGPMDRSEPELSSELVDNMQIEIIRVTEQLVQEEVVTPYQIIRTPTRSLNRGQSREVRPGVNGKAVNTYRLLIENGQVQEKTLVESITLVEKQDKIVEEGIIDTITRGGQVLRYSKVLNVVATAYTADYNPEKGGPDDPWRGMTASGKRAVAGLTIAADPKVIPMHTRVYVEGTDAYGKKYSGIYEVMDTGSAIKGNKIDIFMSTYDETKKFGRRQIKVYILE